MCSVNEEEEYNTCMQEKEVQNVTGLSCKKCNENIAVVLLQGKDAYCRDCFLALTTHKFRGNIGKRKCVKSSDHVLVAHSGSLASTGLLHMLMTGLQEEKHKRLPFTVSVLYIDEGVLLGQSYEESKWTCKQVEDQVATMNLPLFLTTVSRCLEDVSNEKMCCDSSDNISTKTELDKKLINLFDSVKSLTAKEDLLCKLRYKVFEMAAKELGCSKIFVADNATSLSQRLLSNVALGRGAHLPLDIGFSDTHNPEVPVLRPLREIVKKELAYYCEFNHLYPVFIPSITTKGDPYCSIQKLTEKFVTDLDVNFPSTVYTVFRTADKLSLGKAADLSGKCCPLCKAPLDTRNPHQSSALQATLFSQLVSASGPSRFNYDTVGKALTCRTLADTDAAKENDESKCNNCSCEKNSSPGNITESELNSTLCYGCRVIIREMDHEGIQFLPSDVLSKIEEETQLEKMREQIQDFLL